MLSTVGKKNLLNRMLRNVKTHWIRKHCDFVETYLYLSLQLTVILACFFIINPATVFQKMWTADCWWSMNCFALLILSEY